MIVWLMVFTRILLVPWAFTAVVVTTSPAIVVVTVPGEAVILQFFIFGPRRHHIAEFRDGLGSLPAEVPEDVPVCESLMKVVDDILVGDVGDGGALLEEMSGVLA